jgi:hypothetical protein
MTRLIDLLIYACAMAGPAALKIPGSSLPLFPKRRIPLSRRSFLKVLDLPRVRNLFWKH